MYTKQNPFIIESAEDAVQILKYFHDFHDGFIKRMCIESQDYFHEDVAGEVMSRSMAVTGELQLKIDIAHYNYGSGKVPFYRGVCLVFDEFYELDLAQTQNADKDWIINEISLNQVSRPLETDPTYRMKLFEFRWKKPVYDEVLGWSERDLCLFTFSKALVWEEDWKF